MKKIAILIVSLAFAPCIIHSQQNQKPDPKSKGSTETTENQFMKRSKVIPISEMDQRKMYRWSTGEHATPTGRQAMDTSAKYARVYGDSAVVVDSKGRNK